MRTCTTYTDYLDRPTQLTPEEIAWFEQIVEQARQATDCPVQIVPFDHDLMTGKSKNALGTTYTHNPDDPLAGDAETYIDIDCYFIDEQYKARFADGFTFGDTLEAVIAHEIAHLYVWRHGKKHSKLTEQILNTITEYQRKA